MSVCNCVISVKKCFLSPNNGFLRFCQGKTQIPIKNYILNSTNRITTVLCQKCLAQQAHIIRASTLHPSSTILLLSYIFLCEQKNNNNNTIIPVQLSSIKIVHLYYIIIGKKYCCVVKTTTGGLQYTLPRNI